jgi:hypothetical protein
MQMVDMVVERAWFSLLLEDSKKASRKAAILEQQDKMNWIKNQLEDEDMSEWLDWDNYNPTKTPAKKKVTTIKDWAISLPKKGPTINLVEDSMEVELTVQQLEREERLWRASMAKKSWVEAREDKVTQRRARRKAVLEKKKKWDKVKKLKKELEGIALESIEKWWSKIAFEGEPREDSQGAECQGHGVAVEDSQNAESQRFGVAGGLRTECQAGEDSQDAEGQGRGVPGEDSQDAECQGYGVAREDSQDAEG